MAHLFGLRFFTDMALFLFTKAALEGNKIDVFNNGEMLRDFTYIVEGVIDNPPCANPNWNHETSSAPYKVYNNNPVKLLLKIN